MSIFNNLKCDDCDYNNLEINNNSLYKEFINSSKNIYDKEEYPATSTIELSSMIYCNLCNNYNHKVDKCPLLFDNILRIKYNGHVNNNNNRAKKSILKQDFNNKFDICKQLKKLNLKKSNKHVKFNLD